MTKLTVHSLGYALRTSRPQVANLISGSPETGFLDCWTDSGEDALLFFSPEDVIVTDKYAGEVLSEHLIGLTKRYWAKKKRLGKSEAFLPQNYAVFCQRCPETSHGGDGGI